MRACRHANLGYCSLQKTFYAANTHPSPFPRVRGEDSLFLSWLAEAKTAFSNDTTSGRNQEILSSLDPTSLYLFWNRGASKAHARSGHSETCICRPNLKHLLYCALFFYSGCCSSSIRMPFRKGNILYRAGLRLLFRVLASMTRLRVTQAWE